MMRGGGLPYQEALQRFQAAYVNQVLAKHQGHLGKTAMELGMHRNTMTRTMRVLQKHIGINNSSKYAWSQKN